MTTSKKIKLAVSGAMGRMGQRILALAAEDTDFDIVAVLERPRHPQLGDLVFGQTLSAALEKVKDADVWIDFSSAEAVSEHAACAACCKIALVVGITGLAQTVVDVLRTASRSVPVVYSPNMSVGVNFLFDLAHLASGLPADYRVSIVETHHVHKKDAPSGTAKKLAEIIRESSGRDDVDVQSIREGEVVGDHQIIFESPWDTLTLSHSAKTRDIFAIGALRAAKFAVGAKPGFYDMADVLHGASGKK